MKVYVRSASDSSAVKCSIDTYRPRRTHTLKILMLAHRQGFPCTRMLTHTQVCTGRLAGIADWMSMEVTRHHIGLSTQYTLQATAADTHNQNMYMELLNKSIHTRSFSLTYTAEHRV